MYRVAVSSHGTGASEGKLDVVYRVAVSTHGTGAGGRRAQSSGGET